MAKTQKAAARKTLRIRLVRSTIGFDRKQDKVVTGLGLGPTMPTVQVVVQTIAGHKKLGASTALSSFSRALGAALGTVAVGAVVYGLLPEIDLSQLRSGGITLDAGHGGILRAFHVAFFVIAVVAALGAFIASRVRKVRI